MKFRDAEAVDLVPLSRALSPDLSKAQLTNRFSEQRAGLRNLLVAELEGELIGTVSYDSQPDSDDITRRLFALDVGPKFRRTGVATALVKEVERRIKQAGQTAVRLDVAVDNIVAIRLYEKLGYERVGQPTVLRWIRQIDGDSTETVTETSHRMIKRLR